MTDPQNFRATELHRAEPQKTELRKFSGRRSEDRTRDQNHRSPEPQDGTRIGAPRPNTIPGQALCVCLEVGGQNHSSQRPQALCARPPAARNEKPWADINKY